MQLNNYVYDGSLLFFFELKEGENLNIIKEEILTSCAESDILNIVNDVFISYGKYDEEIDGNRGMMYVNYSTPDMVALTELEYHVLNILREEGVV